MNSFAMLQSNREQDTNRLYPRRTLTVRFWIAALLIVPLNTLWILYSEVVRYAGHPTTLSLFYNVLFWFVLLLLVNGILRRTFPRLMLNRAELMTLYIVLGITSGLAGHDTVEVLLPILSHAAHHADAANGWGERLLPLLPTWLTVQDKPTLKAFYNGHSNLLTEGHWQPWLVPVLVWSGFLGLLTTTMLCMNVLLRRQWTESERLAFPLVQIPLDLSDPDSGLWRNGLLWLGIGLAVALQMWNGMAHLYPSLPTIPIKGEDYGKYITTRPWNAVGWLPIGFYPFAISLGILLPLELSFSAWFFFLFWKGQFILSSANGWDHTPNFPYVPAQSLGAYLGIALSSLWGARRVLGRVFGSLLGGEAVDDPGAPIPLRAAGWILVLCGGSLLLFCHLAGMNVWIAAIFLTLYFGIAIAVTRMRAELGAPIHDAHESGPHLIITAVAGPTNLQKGDLTLFALFHGFNRAYRGHVMPIQMEGFKTAERQVTQPKTLFYLMLATGFVAPLLAFTTLLHLGYQYGAEGAMGPPNVMSIFGAEGWRHWDSWTKTPRPPDTNMGIAVVVGTLFALLLQVLRTRVIGFPFHPVGYAIASSWGMSLLWVPMFIAWLAKTTLLRYGGLSLYRRALPFVYGVIVGECVMGSIWTLISLFSGVETYGFWP